MKKCIILLLLTNATFSYAQRVALDYIRESQRNGANYYQIVKQAREGFSRLNMTERNNRKAEKQFERWAYYWGNYINADGTFPTTFPEFALLNLKPNSPLQPQNNTLGKSSEPWVQIGPVTNVLPHGYVAYPGMGRVNCVRKLAANTYIVATPNGGIWKTTNNGVNWLPKTDVLARIGVTDIQVDPTNSSVIYAITGDRDADHTLSVGVIKSTDGGETWSTTGLVITPSSVSGNISVSNIAMNPTDPNTFIVNINEKNYYTNNGGTTFTASNSDIPFANDIVWVNNSNGNAIYVSDIFGKIYRSVNGGADFTQIYNDNHGVSNIVMRFNQMLVGGDIYFLLGKKDSAIVYKFTHDTVTTNISPTSVGAVLSDFNPQGIYNIAITVNPVNSSKIMVFGVDGYYTSNSGATWAKKLDAYSSTTSGEVYVHPDHHFANYLDSVNVLLTHDGGVGVINTSTQPFGHQDLTGNLIISQIYYTAIVNSDTANQNMLMGLQDNDGFSKSPATQSGQWVAVSAGDGTAAAINYNNHAIRYLGGTKGSLSRTSTAYQAGYNDKTQLSTPDSLAPFVWELVMHDTNPNHLFGGFGQLYYTNDEGSNWIDAGFDVGPVKDVEQRGGRIAAIGANGQRVAKYSTVSGISDTLTIQMPAGITVNFNSISLGSDSVTMYATVAGYDNGNKVFKSTDNGQTWTNISGNLPNLVMNKVITKIAGLRGFDEILFVATNVGVYYKEGSTTTSWNKLGLGFPNTSVTDLDINYTTDRLIASTFGRGIWQINLSQPISTGVLDKTMHFSMINIYPNPEKQDGVMSVKLPDEISNQVIYQIFNYVGGKVSGGIISRDKNRLNISNLAPGVYLIDFKEENSMRNILPGRIVID